MFVAVFRRMLRNKQANVAMTFALALVPLVFAIGFGIDYTSATYREDQLTAIADAAALSAVTPSMMAQPDSSSVAAAINTYKAQASLVRGITFLPISEVTVNVADTLTTRTVTVTFVAASLNSFANVLGSGAIPLGGSSQAVGALAPNIDFYLLLDSSPSMAIAATQAGINTMVANTSTQSGGCAFGCHESDPAADALGNPGGEDNYALARNLGVTLRIDNLRTAAQQLMTTAQTTEVTNHASYRMALYSFDYSVTTLGTLTSNLGLAGTDASNLTLLEVYKNNCLTSANCNSDEETNYDLAMTTVNTAMPPPGNGTNSKGDTPQEVLFFVTDGVEDEYQSPAKNPTSSTPGRQQYLMNSNTDWCGTIKTRGIRIAILYTEYLPLPTNAWYNNFDGTGAGIASFQPQIAQQLQNCASPGLYYEVKTGGDISAALSDLFQIAVQTSFLSR